MEREDLRKAIENRLVWHANAAPRYWHPLAKATYDADEILEVMDCLTHRQTTMGANVKQFEEDFAAFVGVDHAVMVNSGSSADLLLSMLMGPLDQRADEWAGNEVLVSAVTWPTQVWSLLAAGFDVRLVDVDPDTLNMDLDKLHDEVTADRTIGIASVHLLGNPVDSRTVDALATTDFDLFTIEDCCEALGARLEGEHVGSRGAGHGAFSFFFSHHMSTMEGGMITTNDDDDADRLRMWRSHGWARAASQPQDEYPGIDARYAFPEWGMNVRPMEIQGAFGVHQLRKLPGFLNDRALRAREFRDFISTTAFLRSPKVLTEADPAWMALPIMIDSKAPYTRKDLTEFLEANGIETRPIVAGNISRQPAMRAFRDRITWGHLDGADEVHRQGFYIGLFPGADIERVIRTFQNFEGGKGV